MKPTLFVSTAFLLLLASSRAQYRSFLPVLSKPFTATFVCTTSSSGYPAQYRPAPAQPSNVNQKTCDQLHLPYPLALKAGQSLVTLSSDGTNTLYEWQQGEDPTDILIFAPKHTSLFHPSVVAYYHDGKDLSLVPFELPPVPFTLPSTHPFICKRDQPAPIDKVLSLPSGTKNVFVLYTRSVMSQSPPYVTGYALPHTADWSTYWVGSTSEPNYKVTLAGKVIAGDVSLPVDLEEQTSSMIAMGKGKENPLIHNVYHFKLLSFLTQPLTPDRFKLETYLKEGSPVDIGKAIIQYHVGRGSLDDQMKLDDSDPHPPKPTSGIWLAITFGAILIVLVILAAWKRFK